MKNLFLSVLTSLFWAGVLGGCLHFIRRRGIDKRKGFFHLWGLLYLLFFLRILYFFDPGIGKQFHVPWLLNGIFELLYLHKFSILSFRFSVVNLLSAAAVLGALIKLVWFLKKYIRIKGVLQDSLPLSWVERAVFERVKERFPESRSAALYKSTALGTPVSMGILKKVICLPENSFSEKELENIFLHEMYHFRNHDHILHFLAKIAECVFWWFPPVGVLSRDFEQFIELRCDACVAGKMDAKEKESYLRAIAQVLKGERKQPEEVSGVILEFAAVSSDKKVLTERFWNVVECRQRTEKPVLRILLTGLFLGLYVLSYRFVLAPAYYPETEDITEGAPGAEEINVDDGALYYFKSGEILLLTEQGDSEVDQETAEALIKDGIAVYREE